MMELQFMQETNASTVLQQQGGRDVQRVPCSIRTKKFQKG